MTYIPAEYSELNIILFVSYTILEEPIEIEVHIPEWRTHTLMTVSRATAEPSATWAGGILQASFARVKTWISGSNADSRVP